MEHRRAALKAAVLLGMSVFLWVHDLPAQQRDNWDYYRSNAVGMKLEKISPDQTPEFVLKIRTLPSGTREEVLLQQGEEVYTIRVKKRGRETVEQEFRDGVKVRETRKKSGRPVYEWEKGEDNEAREREYRWDGESLLSYTERIGDKENEVVYLTGSEGRLGQVRENGKITSYVHSEEGELSGEWISSGDKDEIISYGTGGRYTVQLWNREELVSSKISIPENGALRVIQKDESTGEEVTEIYDEEDRLREKTIRKEGILTRETYSYNNGRLTEKTLRSPKRDRVFLYSYDEEGELRRVDVREDGRRSKKIIYRGGDDQESGEREEVIYRNEKPLYRDVYRGEELILRESID
ncbi:MAG: hypothetical protein R6V67_04350 [Spirochaetia bacterium]